MRAKELDRAGDVSRVRKVLKIFKIPDEQSEMNRSEFGNRNDFFYVRIITFYSFWGVLR
jgi:hypothetical protein